MKVHFKKDLAGRALSPISLVVIILLLWECVCRAGLVPNFILPRPSLIFLALVCDAPLIFFHLKITLIEAALGVLFSVVISFVVAAFMDNSPLIKLALNPILIITQTVPTIAIAPLFVLWFGYGALSKVLLITLTCFFPLTVSLVEGFAATDKDEIGLFRTFGAGRFQIFFRLKVPSSLPYFLSGLKIALSYSIGAAVVSEWLGGNEGLGVYMIRVKKSYALDKLFAAIFVVSLLSIALMKAVDFVASRVDR